MGSEARSSAGRHDGHVALITGAASGIGRATAVRLASEGAAVACLDIDDAGVEVTARDIRSQGGRSTAIACDVTLPDMVARAVSEAGTWHGRLDVLVNCVGVGSIDRTEDVGWDEWSRVLSINLGGMFLVTKAALPSLLAARGNVVNVASIAGLNGWRYMAAYAASKGGVIALTKSMAAEYADRLVRFNCVAPGSVDTPLARGLEPPEGADERLLDRRRALLRPQIGQPEEIAGAIAYLASAEARFVTGSVLVIDGGATV